MCQHHRSYLRSGTLLGADVVAGQLCAAHRAVDETAQYVDTSWMPVCRHQLDAGRIVECHRDLTL
ncbi:MAG: hypothetical protein ABS76_38435 [Pelagibacterium sp. SCN 64-44]|nr:MAG: hypothetical protein ABS76_38435 [Pelagibacterium sp. SCN 64-44]